MGEGELGCRFSKSGHLDLEEPDDVFEWSRELLVGIPCGFIPKEGRNSPLPG